MFTLHRRLPYLLLHLFTLGRVPLSTPALPPAPTPSQLFLNLSASDACCCPAESPLSCCRVRTLEHLRGCMRLCSFAIWEDVFDPRALETLKVAFDDMYYGRRPRASRLPARGDEGSLPTFTAVPAATVADATAAATTTASSTTPASFSSTPLSATSATPPASSIPAATEGPSAGLGDLTDLGNLDHFGDRAFASYLPYHPLAQVRGNRSEIAIPDGIARLPAASAVLYNRRVVRGLLELASEPRGVGTQGGLALDFVGFLNSPVGTDGQGWHTDNHRAEGAMKMQVPLRDVARELGPVELKPDPAAKATCESVRAVTRQGSAVLYYHSRTVHRGTANRGKHERTVLDFSFMSPEQLVHNKYTMSFAQHAGDSLHALRRRFAEQCVGINEQAGMSRDEANAGVGDAGRHLAPASACASPGVIAGLRPRLKTLGSGLVTYLPQSESPDGGVLAVHELEHVLRIEVETGEQILNNFTLFAGAHEVEGDEAARVFIATHDLADDRYASSLDMANQLLAATRAQVSAKTPVASPRWCMLEAFVSSWIFAMPIDESAPPPWTLPGEARQLRLKENTQQKLQLGDFRSDVRHLTFFGSSTEGLRSAAALFCSSFAWTSRDEMPVGLSGHVSPGGQILESRGHRSRTHDGVGSSSSATTPAVGASSAAISRICADVVASRALLDAFRWGRSCASALFSRHKIGSYLSVANLTGQGVTVGLAEGGGASRATALSARVLLDSCASCGPLVVVGHPSATEDSEMSAELNSTARSGHESWNSASVAAAVLLGSATEAKTMLAPHSHRHVVLRMPSTVAARAVLDGSLDFVYLDARHDYVGAKQDLEAWWPKLRPSGLIAGGNYWSVAEGADERGKGGVVQVSGVKKAVDEFTAERGLRDELRYAIDAPVVLLVHPRSLYSCSFGLHKP